MLLASRPGYAWAVLAMATLVVFCALGLARFGYSSVLPAMQTGLRLSNTDAGLLATANLAGYLLFCVVGGALASRVGPRAVITAGLCVAGASMAMTGLVQTLPAAMFWRTVTGVGSGASNVPVMGLMAAWFARERRGTATGVAVAGSSLALMLVGPLAPRLLTIYGDAGWRLCWLAFGLLTVAIAAAAFVVLRNQPAPANPGVPEPTGLAGSPTSPAGGLRWGLVYRSPAVWRLGLIYTAFGFSYIIYMTFFVKHLLDAGYTPAAAGGLFMLMGACSLFSGLIWGTLSDRIGRPAALAAVYVTQAFAYGAFALGPLPAAFPLSAILFGLTAWSIPAIMAAACGDLLGPRLTPAALGFITLFFGVGQALGPYAAGVMADAFHSLSPAFGCAAVVALAGAAACRFWLMRPNARADEGTHPQQRIPPR